MTVPAICPHGHDRRVTGAYKHGQCVECHKEHRRRWERKNTEKIRKKKIARRARRWGVPVEFVGKEAVYLSGQDLRRTRESLGFSRDRLAALAGVSYGCIAHIELYGKKPHPPTQKKLIDALAPFLSKQRKSPDEMRRAGLL